jgi:hypothetical protein
MAPGDLALALVAHGAYSDEDLVHNLPASASLEKLPVHSTKVLPSCSPEVTAKQRIVLRTLV